MARERKRITQVTTRAGDKGTTSLADGSKLAKTDPRMHAIGTVDELNSFIGLLVTQLEPDAAPTAPANLLVLGVPDHPRTTLHPSKLSRDRVECHRGDVELLD